MTTQLQLGNIIIIIIIIYLHNALYGKLFSESVSVQATNKMVKMGVKLPVLFGPS